MTAKMLCRQNSKSESKSPQAGEIKVAVKSSEVSADDISTVRRLCISKRGHSVDFRCLAHPSTAGDLELPAALPLELCLQLDLM